MKILIVEDEIKIAHMLARGFAGKGHGVDIITSGAEAIKQVAHKRSGYDVVILDLELPDTDGYDVCRKIREKNRSISILVLTALQGTKHKGSLLRAGADDYLQKPFSFDELSIRVEKLPKRPVSREVPEVLSAQDLSLDPSSRNVTRDGEPIRLTDKEFDLLEYFMKNQDRVINREELLTQLWDYNYTSFFSNVLDVHIKNLRRKIDHANSPSILETVRGIGYRLRI